MSIPAGNGSASFDVTSRLQQSTTYRFGLAATNDGFPSMLVPPGQMQFAQDNDKCISDVSGLVLDVVYNQPPPAASPSCTSSVSCDDAVTLSCSNVPYDARIDRLDAFNGNPWWRTIASQPLATRTGAPGIYDNSSGGLIGGDTATYRICSTSPNASEETCAQIVVARPHSNCGGGGGGGGVTPIHRGPILFQ